MMCVYYKFSSQLDYQKVTFSGLHITLNDLKRQIMAREGLKATNCDLQIADAQTQEEYTGEAHILKYSSVVVRRTPVFGAKPAHRRSIDVCSHTAMMGYSRPTFFSPSLLLSKTANLVDTNALEEDKIKAMMHQSSFQFHTIHHSKKGVWPPPPTYICYRCLKPGHYIQECPMLMNQDESVEGPTTFKTSKGIPLSFMVKTKPGAKGAMMTNTGEYMIPAINVEAYAQGKKDRPPFVPHEHSSPEDNSDPIPDELLCPICNNLITDAVIIPCCGSSYCDECIRNALLDSEEHICFTCKQSGVSPDNLDANKFLRKAVENFKNETECTKHAQKQVQHAALPPSRSQSISVLPSKQHDLLLDNVIHPHTPSVPTTAAQAQVLPPASTPAIITAAAPTPAHVTVVADHHSPMHSPSKTAGPEGTSHSYRLPVSFHPPPPRLNPISGHQSRPHHCHRGKGRPWKRFNRDKRTHQMAPPPAPAPPVYSSSCLYLPSPQHPYPPPYISGPGIITPTTIGYQPSPMFAPGPPGHNHPWVAPGIQPPQTCLIPFVSQPPLYKDFYKQWHRQDIATSKGDELTRAFHNELIEFRNTPKRTKWSYSRSPSYSPSPSKHTHTCSRSRSRTYSYSPSQSHSHLHSYGGSFPHSPNSRCHGHSYECSWKRSLSHSKSYGYQPYDSPYLGRGWKEAEGAGPYRWRSRSRSPDGYWSCSPSGQKPLIWQLPPYKLKGLRSEGEECWERERYLQWENENTDWCKKYYKEYNNQYPSLNHRSRSSRDRERDMSPLSKHDSPQRSGRGGKEEIGALSHYPTCSSSSRTKFCSKIMKKKKLKKKKTGDKPEPSHQSVDRGDATPVRDEPMDEIPSLTETPPLSSKHSSGSEVTEAPVSISSAVPVKPSNKASSKTLSGKTKKEKGQKVKAKVKTKHVKAKCEKQMTGEGLALNNKDSSSPSAANLLKTSPLSSQSLPIPHPSVHDGP